MIAFIFCSAVALALAALLWTDADRLRALHFLDKHVLPEPRVIMDRAGGTPYLARWYLIGNRPKVDDHGNPIGVVKKDAFQVLLHHFFRGDHDGELHSHPWRWAVAIVLAGGYTEERRVGDSVIVRRCGPGTINVIHADDYHRVDLLGAESWSIFITGPKVADWYFWCRNRLARAPWRPFLAWKQDKAAPPTWTPDVRDPELAEARRLGFDLGIETALRSADDFGDTSRERIVVDARHARAIFAESAEEARLRRRVAHLERALLTSEAERDALRAILESEGVR